MGLRLFMTCGILQSIRSQHWFPSHMYLPPELLLSSLAAQIFSNNARSELAPEMVQGVVVAIKRPGASGSCVDVTNCQSQTSIPDIPR